jgi:DNA-binding transcriptional regulator YbjK
MACGRAPPRGGRRGRRALSATTYYFKDIDDLLTDTFAQYVERSAAFMAKLWVAPRGLLRQMVARAMAARIARRNWPVATRG